MSKKELSRLEVMKRLEEKRLKQKEAAAMLGVRKPGCQETVLKSNKKHINALRETLTANLPCVIVLRMRRFLLSADRSGGLNKLLFGGLILLLPILVALVGIACTQSSDNPIFKPPSTTTFTPTTTNTPTPTATPTPTPTPTPIPSARVKNAQDALFIGDWDTALEEYQAAQQFSSDEDVQSAAGLGIGKTYYLSGNYYEAAQVLGSLVENYPNSPHLATAYFYLGQAHIALEHYTEAAQAYQNYLNLRPGTINGYVLDMRGDALFSAGDYFGAVNDYQAALVAGSLLDGEWIELKSARAMALSGDYQAALDLYDNINHRTTNENTKALIDLRKGQIYTLLGQPDFMIASYSDAVNNYPTTYEAYSALVELVNAEISVNELQRGIIDYYAGQYGVALAAFDRYLQNDPLDPGTAYYFSGLANRELGGYGGAISQWEKVIQNYPEHPYWDEAWEQMAYTQWAFLDHYTLATENLLNFVSIAPEHPRAAEFLYDAALVAERADNLELAAESWRRVASLYPDYERADRALFLSGITQYRLAKYADALATFQMLSLEASSLEYRAAAHMWIGKIKQTTGDETAAKESWETAANIDPTGYYSERARDLMREREPFQPPTAYDLVIDKAKERAQAEEWLRSQFYMPEGTDLSGPGELVNSPYFIRANELWDLGMYSEARNEFEQLRLSVQSDAVQSYRLMNYLLDLGLYRSAIMAARQVLDLAGMDDAETLNAPAYFNHIRFGTYFSDLIIPTAQEYNFHPLFLFSLIRQESLFESFIRSSAAASGLMQIIPATGADIANNLGWPADYSPEDLYRPMINVVFGTDYLDTQRNVFSGDLYTALAAYNGGPGNAREWKRLAPHDPDLFLEVIRFSETRDYIRRIYEIHNIYQRLYNRSQ